MTLKKPINLKPDYRIIAFAKRYKDFLLGPLVTLLLKCKISPNQISLAAFSMIVPVIFLYPINSWLSALFILFNFILDGLDGPMARKSGHASKAGALTDLIADHFFLWFVFLMLYFYGVFEGFFAVFYLFNYVILTFVLLLLNFLKINYFFVFKSTYLFFLVYFLYLLSNGQINWFFPYFVLFSIYMSVNNFLLLNKLKNSI